MRHSNLHTSIVLSIVSMFVCLIMLVGTSFAWFNDSSTTGINKIVMADPKVENISISPDEFGSNDEIRRSFLLDGKYMIYEVFRSSLESSSEFKINMKSRNYEEGQMDGIFKVTFENDEILYLEIDAVNLSSNINDALPNIYIQNAKDIEQIGTITTGMVTWCGGGYECIMDGYEGTYFMLGGLCIQN